MMSKAKKKVSGKTKLPDAKQTNVNTLSAPYDHPSWRFSTADMDGPFAWKFRTAEEEQEVLNKLRDFDRMQWTEIEGPRHHSISFNALSPEARKQLSKRGFEEDGKVFSFALGGKKRVFCIREGGIAKLLWYDPEHKACLSYKKHT